MNIVIRDKDVLRRILPSSIGSYLRARGWTENGAIKSDRFIVWDAPSKKGQVLEPLDPDLDDYAQRIYDIIQALSDVENRSQLEVIRELQSVGFDMLGVANILGADADHNVPISSTRDLVGSLYNLAVSAAYAAVEKRPTVPRRRPNRVTEYMSSVKFTQLTNGQLKYALLSPINTQFVGQAALFPQYVYSDVSEPFERSVLRTLITAVNAAKSAARFTMKTGDITAFAEAVDLGVNSTLCDAIVEMSDAITTREPAFSVQWSPRLPSALEDFVVVSASQVDVLQQASAFLKEQGDREEYLLVGPVVLLGRDQQAQEGNIAIAAAVDSRPQKIIVKLPEPEYRAALHAHEERKAVSMKGTLHKEGRNWHLLGPSEFRVFDD